MGGTCVCFGWDLCLFVFSVGLVFVFEWDLCFLIIMLKNYFWCDLCFWGWDLDG